MLFPDGLERGRVAIGACFRVPPHEITFRFLRQVEQFFFLPKWGRDLGLLPGLRSHALKQCVTDPAINAVLEAFGGSAAGRAQLLVRMSINLFVAGEGWYVGVPRAYLDPTRADSETSEIRTLAEEVNEPQEYVWRMLSSFSVASKSPGEPMNRKISNVIATAGIDVHSTSRRCW